MTSRQPTIRLSLFLVATICSLLAMPVSGQTVPAKPTDLPRYDMRIDYRPSANTFEVAGTILLPPTAGVREEVELSLGEVISEPVFALVERGRRSDVAASKVSRPVPDRPGWGTNTWRIRPPRPFAPGKPIELGFRYVLNGEVTAFVFHAGQPLAYGAGINTAWYPQVERESVGKDGALRGLRGTGRLSFTVPDDLTVYASGKPVAKSQGRFDFEVEAPLFFSFAAGRYDITRLPGKVPATAYQFRKRNSTKDMLSRSQALLELFSSEFYPYPHDEFAVIEVPTELADKTGFSGASLEGFIFSTTEFLDKRFNMAFFGHEIGHNWWPYLFSARGAGACLLSDGMVQYGSLRAVEVLEGRKVAERYRRTGYPGYYSEYSGLGYLLVAAAGMDKPLSQIDGSRLARTLCESKGMIVWKMLEKEVGPENFRRALQSMFRENLYQRIPFSDFGQLFSRHVGRDTSWFFEQWFEREGAPDLKMEWRFAGGKVEGRILQVGMPYRLTVPLEIVAASGKRDRRNISVSTAETRFSLPVRERVRSVELDPDFEVLRWTDAYRAEAEALVPHTIAFQPFLASDNDKAIALYRAALAKKTDSDRFGLQFLLHYGLAEALFDKGDHAAARVALEQALASRPIRAEILPVTYLLRAKIAQRQGDRAAFESAIAAVRATDRAVGGDTGASDQLPGLSPPVPR